MPAEIGQLARLQTLDLSHCLAGMVSLNGGDEDKEGGDEDEDGEDEDEDGEDEDEDEDRLEPCATCGAESTETHYGVDYCYDLPDDDDGDHGADFGELEHLPTPPAFDPAVLERFRDLGGELQWD